MTDTTDRVSAASFEALFAEVSHWDGDGDEDLADRSALRHLTPERVAAAASLVRDGRTVSLGRRLDTHLSADNPQPAVHVMTQVPDSLEPPDAGAATNLGRDRDTDSHRGSAQDRPGVRFAKDYVGVDYHNDTHSHLDALCHVAFRGRLFGGTTGRAVNSYGAEYGTVELLSAGLVGRGVLLDIPSARGVPWLEPGDSVVPGDLDVAERLEQVRVGAGDVLLVRTGHARRLTELGPWETSRAKAGLHPDTATFMARRNITALGSDGNSDTAPSTTEGVGFPIHVLAINAIGIHLLDYLQLEELAACCHALGRWEFLFVAAPLRIPGGTGSPVNPIAIF
jgi:kynurenine formamidase